MENEKNLQELSEEETTAEEVTPAEETVSAQEETPEEMVSTEETVTEDSAPVEEKKATPGKMALVIAAIVVVIAIIAALLAGGMGLADKPAETVPAETAAAEETVPATIPADGNPDDETCKGTYTVSNEEAVAAADAVVATIGNHTLTNGQLQAFYWMQVQSFLSSEYGNMMMYYGMLDYTQPLDTQTCAMAETGTWQQFFLKEALNSWRNYCALADKAAQSGMTLSAEEQAYLDSMEDNLATTASYYGLESAEDLLYHNFGAGVSMEDYRYFQELLMQGNLYYDAEYAKLTATQEELEAFYAEHESEYTESGITKDGKYVDVRHILFTPEGGTTDETGATTYSEEEWEACRVKAEDVLNQWKAGEATEESFAALATQMTQDPGSQSTGGLYQNVYEGQMVPEFEQWCFDESRAIGDSGMVKTTYGYHLMYFVGSTPIWQYYAQQDLITEKSGKMMDEVIAEYPMEVSYGDIVLSYVNMAG